MDSVCVILTTYNPNKYLLEQVDSILNQENVDVEIIIRDDGSTDKSYLEKIRNIPKITILEGENLGVGNNIMTLLQFINCNKQNYEYYAYSDQDDVWLPDKLKTAISHLSSMNLETPCLYYSNLQVVDENLNKKHMLFKKGVVENTCGQALAQVFSFACTTVFNSKMVKELVNYDPKEIGFDSLIYYIAIFLGSIYYDETSYNLYRQHGNNLSGSHERGITNIQHRLKQITTIKDSKGKFKYNSTYLLENMRGKLSPYQISLVECVAYYDLNLRNKMKLLFHKEIKGGYYPKNFYNIIRILLNIY